MTASAWADPPAIAHQAALNERNPLAWQLRDAPVHAVASCPAGRDFPAMAAIRADVDREQCWEITGLGGRFSARDLMFMSSHWRVLSGVDGEVCE